MGAYTLGKLANAGIHIFKHHYLRSFFDSIKRRNLLNA
jgi:hypothetical protein